MRPDYSVQETPKEYAQ